MTVNDPSADRVRRTGEPMTRPTDPPLPHSARSSSDPSDQGGDPACWAHRVCAWCGRLNDDPQELDVCTACGEPLADR
jgi:hypothetical protein